MYKALGDAARLAANSVVSEWLMKTEHFQVELIASAFTGPLHAEGTVDRREFGRVWVTSKLYDGEGRCMARGSGQFVPSATRLHTLTAYRAG